MSHSLARVTHLQLVGLLILSWLLHLRLANAYPTLHHSSTQLLKPRGSTDGEEKTEQRINERTYKISYIPELDKGGVTTSHTYTIMGGYLVDSGKEYVPAILKIVGRKDASGTDTDREVVFLRYVGLYLDDDAEESDKGNHLIVMKDVRKHFPKLSSPPLKPFHEWYEGNLLFRVRLEKKLKKFRDLIEERLLAYADESEKLPDQLLYEDIRFKNFFVTKDLTFMMPINWSPPTKGFVGVVDISELPDSERKKRYDSWKKELRSGIEKWICKEELDNVLKWRKTHKKDARKGNK